ncbi:MAG: GatB/YqeY domain-containing protein [Pyrinomonadaceae bacterium]|nr:GatB/YqeY domain-containing protein [Pyrinomonadaceae bacterium]
MNLTERILDDIKSAMKAKDAERLSVLRMAKANLMNKKIEKGSELSDGEVVKALQTLVKQRREAADQYEKGGRAELAAKEISEIAFIEEYLPQAASQEEVGAAVENAIAETGASSMKDMGTVMKAAMAHLEGMNADGKMVSETVKAKLA